LPSDFWAKIRIYFWAEKYFFLAWFWKISHPVFGNFLPYFFFKTTHKNRQFSPASFLAFFVGIFISLRQVVFETPLLFTK